MDRRRFAATIAALSGASLIPGRAGARSRQGALRVDADRLNGTLAALARFGRTEDGGISRVAYSDANLDARRYVTGLMGRAGLTVDVDLAGNLIGRRVGRTDRPPILIGSHIDSVPGGGNYDGQVGSMAAIEVAQTLAERDIALRHPLEVVIFQNEEGGKTGSRAWIGEVAPMELDLVTASGFTIRDGIDRLGGDARRLDEARRTPGSLAAFFELHVEQGALLHRGDIDIGVVEGIVGIKRWTVTVTGFANHAGTTPMDARQDAMVGAARFVDLVHRTARGLEGRQVATVGRIAAEPGAPNVIPGRVTLSLEIRDLSMDRIDDVFARIVRGAERIGDDTGTAFAYEQFYVSHAAPTAPGLRDMIEQSAAALDLTAIRMPSGAGHDAQSVARLGPVGMIFVPSVEGISHSPREFTSPDDVANGASVLLNAVIAADAAA